MTCPICRSTRRITLDRRSRIPVLMHNLFDDRDSARGCPVGDVDLVRCLECGFAWNAAFDSDRMVYGPDYDNCQSHSPAFRAHVDDCAGAVVAARPELTAPHVVEVGAGQGTFLERIEAIGAARVGALTGFDPAWRGADGAGPGRARIYRQYFSPASIAVLETPPDVVVSRHTIEHVPDPLQFLIDIRRSIGDHNGVDLFVETPDIEWIVQHGALEDVFYEHCSLFDAESLALAMEMAGFGDVRVETRFGEQYLWAHGRSIAAPAVGRRARPVSPATIDTERSVAGWRQRLQSVSAAGRRTIVWGAGAKGMTFAQIVDPDARLIDAIVDINPGKQGRFIGASGHAVVAPAALRDLRPDTVVVMNPVYADEIRTTIAQMGLQVSLLTLHEM